MYLCTLEHSLPGNGPGRKPDLQVLLSDSGDEPSIIFSADVWCEADRAAALAALGEQVQRSLQGISWSVPAESLAAVRAGRDSVINAHGMAFGTHPVDGDAQACSKVNNDALGAVLMKLDITIKPASKGSEK